MCKDTDLFGDTIVLLDDVELWLDLIPKNLSTEPNSRIRYAKQYDIASKIKRAKQNGSFYQMQEFAEKQQQGLHPSKSAFHPDYLNDLFKQEKPKPHRLAHLL